MSHRYLHNIRQTVECLTSSVFRKTLTTKKASFLHVCPSYLCTICEFQPLMTHLCQYGTTCACFLQMATKKLLITAFVSDRKIVFFFRFFFSYVIMCLFIYFSSERSCSGPSMQKRPIWLHGCTRGWGPRRPIFRERHQWNITCDGSQWA